MHNRSQVGPEQFCRICRTFILQLQALRHGQDPKYQGTAKQGDRVFGSLGRLVLKVQVCSMVRLYLRFVLSTCSPKPQVQSTTRTVDLTSIQDSLIIVIATVRAITMGDKR